MSDRTIIRTHDLATPLQFGSEKIETLEFREPIAKDLDDMPLGKLTFGDLRRFAARITGYPPTAFETMRPDDLGVVIEIANDLLGGDSPTTGGTS